MRLTRAYSKHASATGQSAQIRWASWTPRPSLGKNMAGGMSRHRPSLIQSASMGRSLPRGRAYPCVLRRRHFGLGFAERSRGCHRPVTVTLPPPQQPPTGGPYRAPPPAPPGWVPAPPPPHPAPLWGAPVPPAPPPAPGLAGPPGGWPPPPPPPGFAARGTGIAPYAATPLPATRYPQYLAPNPWYPPVATVRH